MTVFVIEETDETLPAHPFSEVGPVTDNLSLAKEICEGRTSEKLTWEDHQRASVSNKLNDDRRFYIWHETIQSYPDE